MKFRKKAPIDTSCQAEYEDGWILDESQHDDISPYTHYNEDGEVVPCNILRAILEKRPEPEHGKMVRFSVFYQNQRHDIDWRGLPDNARPIRFRNFSGDFAEGGVITNKRLNWLRFGYQFTDPNSGKNVQEVREL